MINYIVNTAVVTALPVSSIWDGTKGKKQVNIVTKCNKDLAWLCFPNQKKKAKKNYKINFWLSRISAMKHLSKYLPFQSQQQKH